MAGVQYYYQEELSSSRLPAVPQAAARPSSSKLKTPPVPPPPPAGSRPSPTSTTGSATSGGTSCTSTATGAVFLIDVIVTALILFFIPHHFYIYYTMKVLLLFPLRWFVSIKDSRKHFFIFEFCAYTHYLNLFYLWSPWKPTGMFPSLFLFANGPVLCTVFFLGNGFILHSIENMCSLFTHSSGALLMWSMKWYPTTGGVTSSNDVELDSSYESLLRNWREIMMTSSLYYLIWAICYSLIVLKLLEKRIIRYDSETSFRCLVQIQRDGLISKLCHIHGERYSKLYYIIFHYTVTVACMTGAFLSYYWKLYHFILLTSFLLLALCNGAKYYLK